MPELITLDWSTPSVQYLCQKDKRLAKVISMVGPISYMPHCQDPYGFMIHEIIEQMLSIKAGAKIYGRLKELCDGDIIPEKIASLSEEQLRGTGTSSSKAKYIKGITESVLGGDLVFEELSKMTDVEVMKKLTGFHGIGNWTAKMYLIFVLNRPDVLPYEDGAFLQAYKWAYKTEDVTPSSVCKKCQKWKPYSSVAARYMYKALDGNLTKHEFHLYK